MRVAVGDGVGTGVAGETPRGCRDGPRGPSQQPTGGTGPLPEPDGEEGAEATEHRETRDETGDDGAGSGRRSSREVARSVVARLPVELVVERRRRRRPAHVRGGREASVVGAALVAVVASPVRSRVHAPGHPNRADTHRSVRRR
ncbi:hypothetical protein N0B31_00160 [Salinirubellus salinus]|uniref:Uncharacterized protein n=1 Tax=Salinirubellus salinus TaxID=1364945 RepID=A0A9E7UBE0_9EURY|nr:hypothetical protein [Salinirubellus salinus]UWM54709.1 hypothetical protein N0B31_00160 [Salinirubellus salinus]